MIPVTPYATERVRHIYGSDQRGFRPASMPLGAFVPDYSGYLKARRTVVGDAQGMFEFASVGDGDYYLACTITWAAGGLQGGSLMQRVHVAGGETKKVTLAP